MNIIIVGSRFGTFSWPDGIRMKPGATLLEEARRNFDAVFNRLFREGKDELAEELFDHLTKPPSPRNL